MKDTRPVVAHMASCPSADISYPKKSSIVIALPSVSQCVPDLIRLTLTLRLRFGVIQTAFTQRGVLNPIHEDFSMLQAYEEHLSRLPLSKHTRRNYLVRVRQYFEWLSGTPGGEKALSDPVERDLAVFGTLREFPLTRLSTM